MGQVWTNNSATAYNYTVSDTARNYLKRGPLRHSMDVYNFIRSIFFARIRAYGLNDQAWLCSLIYYTIYKYYEKICQILCHKCSFSALPIAPVLVFKVKIKRNWEVSIIKYESFSISFSFILPLLIFWFPAVDHLFIIYTKNKLLPFLRNVHDLWRHFRFVFWDK